MWCFMHRVWSVCRMDDGRLLDYLMNHDELMEEKVAFYIRDTMEALQYLHNCRVAHLDIKVRTEENDAVILRPGTESSQLCRQGGGAACTPRRWSLMDKLLIRERSYWSAEPGLCLQTRNAPFPLTVWFVPKCFLDLMKEKKDVWETRVRCH